METKKKTESQRGFLLGQSANWRSFTHKQVSRLIRGSLSDRAPCACAKTCPGEVTMVKMAPTDALRGLLEQEDHRMSEVALTIAQDLPAAYKLSENHFPYVLPTRVNLIIGDVHATVLHGNGVEFGAYRPGPPSRRNLCMKVSRGRLGELTRRTDHAHILTWTNRSCRSP